MSAIKRGAWLAALILAAAFALPAWVESIEFPWPSYPKPLWERELTWMKNIGITHVSLPPGDRAELNDVIDIVRRLGLKADLERTVPDELKPLTTEHGGPLTAPLLANVPRLSALDPRAAVRSRDLLASGASALVWTNVEDTLGADGFHAGAVNFIGQEKAATAVLRRNAKLSGYWAANFTGLHETPGAEAQAPNGKTSAQAKVRQFVGAGGVSVVSVSNPGKSPWTGSVRVNYPALARVLEIPNVTVPADDVLWLPVSIPLTAGPMCKNCEVFTAAEHLVYSTVELTSIEYENGILALEFNAPTAGEAILQLAREPIGPYVAGGHPVSYDWDEHTQRVRLTIPAGEGAARRVRVGLAIAPPDSTAFFDTARVLMIGETNHLLTHYSSDEIEQRSRLRATPRLSLKQQPSKEPLSLIYDVDVPDTAVHGDHASLAFDADGRQLSHAEPQLLRPVSVTFPDAIQVPLDPASALPLYPAALPVNRRTGREFTVTVHNNAPEIRTFQVEPKVAGLDFSPARAELVIGESMTRDITFRVFTSSADPGVHTGTVEISGAAKRAEPLQFVVIPQDGSVAWASSGIWMLESNTQRAAFIPGRWLQFLNKTSNQNLLNTPNMPFTPGAIETRDNTLIFGGQRVVKLDELTDAARTTRSPAAP